MRVALQHVFYVSFKRVRSGMCSRFACVFGFHPRRCWEAGPPHLPTSRVCFSARSWWSERAVRSAHSVLQLVDWRYTPGTCPTYPSSTSRLRAGSFSGAYGYAKEDGIAGDFERRVLALTSEPGRQRSNRTAVPLRRERWRTFGCGKADGWSGRARLRSFSETTSGR